MKKSIQHIILILFVLWLSICLWNNFKPKKNIENFYSSNSKDLSDEEIRQSYNYQELIKAIGPSKVVLSKKQTDNLNTIQTTVDIGGWNNIKMAFEMIVCLAKKYNRAIVLPEPGVWYLIDDPKNSLFDFFDQKSFESVVPVSKKPNNKSVYKFDEGDKCLIETTSTMEEKHFNNLNKVQI